MLSNILVIILNIFIAKIQAWPPLPGKTVGDIFVHDPSMIKKGNEYFVFSTHNNIEIRKSKDRVNFEKIGSAVPWMRSTDVWAPDVYFNGNEYWLYYSTSTFGTQNSCIYMATSKNLISWSNKGKIICSRKGSEYNAIDPNIVKDLNGELWLNFGSFYGGIYIVELTSTGKIKSGSIPKLLARRSIPDAMEGPFIYVHNKMYYLFMSWGNCCVSKDNIKEKSKEPYHIKVCRSKSITGPYTEPSGKKCTDGGGLEILKGQKGIWGVGGQGVYKDGDKDVLYYHYYDANDNYSSKLGINYLTWDNNGWPIAY
jgi:arabinan endo-1,5-alpha-L-arabinosidase